MRFLDTTPVELEDKKLKLKVTVFPPTNETRFTLHDLGQDQSPSGFIRLAEYVLDYCVKAVKVGAIDLSPEEVKKLDLLDEESSRVYSRIIELALEYQLSTLDEEKSKK